MKWCINCIILISTFVVIHSRPQDTTPQNEEATVELLTFPSGLRFPKWLPHPDHQSQYFGKLHHPYTFDPKSNTDFFNNFYSPSPATSSSSQYFHFPRYHKSPETLSIHGLKPQPMKFAPTKIDDKSSKLNVLSNIQESTAPKTVVTSVNDEIKVNDILPRNNQTKQQLTNIQEPASLAPYRAHPLFHYLKNRNTIQKDKIISFRNDQVDNDITTLILKPVARAVAGVEGKAVSTPVSKAILRRGSNVDILFEPEAVAIAGAGGIAHAESDLEISYEDVI